jgi:hypothetical protein
MRVRQAGGGKRQGRQHRQERPDPSHLPTVRLMGGQ